MKFTVISDVTNVQLIAKGNGVDLRHYLNRTYADGRRVHWRKLKGRATVEYANGEIWEVELHWFEASGIAPKGTRRTRRINENFGESHEVRSLYQEQCLYPTRWRTVSG